MEPPKLEPTDADIATVRRLLDGARAGMLATLDAEGAPFASLVTFALDERGHPLFLFSGLAEHARNLARDPRASLLVEDALHLKNPQTGPRVSLAGRLAPSEDAEHRRRFLERHPSAQAYAGFGDFAVWRMAVARAHFVGGFGRALWLAGESIQSP